MVPNFICPGAQKSATTTLYALLKKHPDIYIPDCKETHYFDLKFMKGLDFYEKKFFGNVKKEKIIGEITPSYMYLNYVPKRICNSLGKDIKFIFMLRNPIDRAYSQYWMNYRKGFEKKSFEEAIELEKIRKEKNLLNRIRYSYVDRGFYAKQIKRYLRFFNKENMHFILFEKFISNLSDTTNEIFNFLGIKKINKIESIERNKNSLVVPPMNISTKNRLLNIYINDIHELEKIINENLINWQN